MDDDGSLGIGNWGLYYDQFLKGSLVLQLMSTVAAEPDTAKPHLFNGGFLHRDCGIPEPCVPFEFVRDGWGSHHRETKVHHILQLSHRPNYGILSHDPAGSHTLQMMQQLDPPKEEHAQRLVDEPKKRPQGHPNKLPKPKKHKKAAAPRDEATGCSVPRAKAGKKSMGLVINGIDLDILGIPTPVCSCTGTPQQCYKWGTGGWQSACCTTSLSAYPLPMSLKRRGARIAGRKMSLGAFKKVLEKLAGNGYNLSNPIDLRTFWAKHGTNKFVIIRQSHTISASLLLGFAVALGQLFSYVYKSASFAETW